MIKTKPALAHDAVLSELIFPCWQQPKIDGVRAWNPNGALLGRSMDPHKGFGITEYFSKPEFVGLDGEMILGSKPNCTDRLCSLTTGAMSGFRGITAMQDINWWVFDYLTEETLDFSYEARYYALADEVLALHHPRVHLVPYTWVDNLSQANEAIANNAEAGYEGTVFRNPSEKHKPGRPTKKGQQLMRVKPWSDSEAIITGIVEGSENQNEAKVNSLGRTERSSAQEGKVPNGKVGSLKGKLLADFFDPYTGKLLFPKDLAITMGKGEMTDAEAIHYFNHPDEIVGHVVKFQHMTHGVLDLPRFGGYLSHRSKEDMS